MDGYRIALAFSAEARGAFSTIPRRSMDGNLPWQCALRNGGKGADDDETLWNREAYMRK